jgi:glycosyltransferase involved in cell wall biosynthesis
MKFSILMCSKNSELTIEKAINSVITQSCESWELLILDNGSTDRTWEIIEQSMQSDQRIKAVRLENNVGWAKGASLCLRRAQGEYMTFLAADDFLLGEGSLGAVERCIEREKPDIVWVGHIPTKYTGGGYLCLGGIIPQYTVYDAVETDRISGAYEIMRSLYYNSFFHYVNIEFLRKNQIDFYEPYYGDCEGMTEAMCQAQKMVILDQPIYALTMNTSQTSGAYVWGKDLIMQWRSICNAVLKYGEYDLDKLRYIAVRILNNSVGELTGFCDGIEVRDTEMNSISKTSLERFVYVEEVLQTEEYTEMFYYAGRERYLQKVFQGVKELYARCIMDGYSEEDISSKVKWLPHLVTAFCDWNGEQFVDREELDMEHLEEFYLGICHEENTGVWGYELANNNVQINVTSHGLAMCNEIQGRWADYFAHRIYELLYTAAQIKQRGRMQEVTKIVRECMNIFRNFKEYLSEPEIQQIAEDMKMILK